MANEDRISESTKQKTKMYFLLEVVSAHNCVVSVSFLPLKKKEFCGFIWSTGRLVGLRILQHQRCKIMYFN